MKQAIALPMLLCAAWALAIEPSPRNVIAAFLQAPDVPGEVFTQARDFDHFDYREKLRLAAAKNQAALSSLLDYNQRTSLIGAGAENHAAILVALLEIWGDKEFAKALGSSSPKAVSATLDFLEYGGASKARFPRTFSVRSKGANKSFKPNPLRGSA